ncbi:Uncharacterized protein Adt_35152 [Abeliophyllum distichum]|uniref:Uncharacterized protein n=1 Tax=Abeliophyllum distichum TaxID=126358 RepID=A0ABD1QHX8_9LAMI
MQNTQKSYAKEAEGTLMTNWLINSRPSRSKKVNSITFAEEDIKNVHYPYCGVRVVRTVMAKSGLGRMLVDNRSSVNVIFLSTFEQINIETSLALSLEPLYGFTTYHGVLGRSALKELWVVTSIQHMCMKFSTERGIAAVKGNQLEANKFYRIALQKAETKKINMTFIDVEMTEALEEAPDVTTEDATSPEDINPRKS